MSLQSEELLNFFYNCHNVSQSKSYFGIWHYSNLLHITAPLKLRINVVEGRRPSQRFFRAAIFKCRYIEEYNSREYFRKANGKRRKVFYITALNFDGMNVPTMAR